jgi:serine phosphatase RsbU (regulator of sigma subunit)
MDDRKVNVLLIEDDESDYLIARRLLSRSAEPRFDVAWANTLESGLARVGPAVDAILLDLTLPDSRGWETFVRAYAGAPAIPIILLTGVDDEALGVRAVHGGAQDYLVKGRLDTYLLCRAVLHAIERKKIKDRLEQLVEELRIRNERMEADLSVAREAQLALMPRAYPTFPPGVDPPRSRVRFAHIYRPCRTVGGDFFSVTALSDTAAGVFIGDVMGHGMRSALVTAVLRGLLEELRAAAGNPGELLTEVSRALNALLRQPRELIFVSALYLVIDSATGCVSGANAGHPLPLVLPARAGGARPLEFPAPAFGPALGILEGHTYGVTNWRVEEGDRLLLYTDGLVELADESGADYGCGRLAAAATRHGGEPIESLVREVMADAERFAGRPEFEDDICLVAAELAGGAVPAVDLHRGGKGA